MITYLMGLLLRKAWGLSISKHDKSDKLFEFCKFDNSKVLVFCQISHYLLHWLITGSTFVRVKVDIENLFKHRKGYQGIYLIFNY